MFCVSLSGVPGAGKTTLLRRLKETRALEKLVTCEIRYVFEPSDLWREQGWLKKYYDNPNDNALWFQLIAFDTHVDQVRKQHTEKEDTNNVILFMERSMYDQLLFWTMQIRMGYRVALDPNNQDAYMRIWRKWKLLVPPIKLIFFCDTSTVQKTMSRIYDREGGEKSGTEITKAGGIGVCYQTELREMHTKWYTKGTATIDGDDVQCYHLNTDGPFNVNDEELTKLATQIAQQIKLLLLK